MKNEALFNDEHRATYCPEDDKIRLYVDRVPKEEYLALRAEGWKSTPKQDCDFVAVWTTDREDTALSYAGIILDEDQDPADRAADRAERFSGYLDKRRAEAHGHADSYESGPQAHGYQNQQKAERAAARHDRHADRAIDAWSKAEYWQSRTAGVIRNALYKSTPGVRMGRIKKLEAEQRKIEKAQAENNTVRDMYAKFAENNDTEAAAKVAYCRLPFGGPAIVHPRLNKRMSLSDAFRDESDPITAKEASEALQKHYADGRKSRGQIHIELRLAYERQMLEAAGGRAGDIEIKTGGTFSGGVIAKVNKSPATGRAVSVAVIVPAFEGWAYKMTNTKGTKYALMQIDCERAAPGAYQEPTEASRAKLEEYRAAVKATKKSGPKLINPTLEEAQRLQNRLNSDDSRRNYPKSADVTEWTQEQYSDRSRGSDCVGTELYEIDGNAFKVRSIWRMGAHSVVCITDKPQKGLPAFFPTKPEPKPTPAEVEKAARMEKQEKEKEQLRAFMDGKAETATIKAEPVPVATGTAAQGELF